MIFESRHGARPERSAASAPGLVLDTNVALDWLAFGDPRVRALVAAIERGAVRLVTDEACLEELRRALAYPELKLDAAAQARALARYLGHARRLDGATRGDATKLPRCADPDDQKFLGLAWQARAAWLLTRDKALLALARRLAGEFSIVTPQAFAVPQS